MNKSLPTSAEQKGNLNAFAFFLRAGILAVLWIVVTGGAADSWLIGLPVVLVAACLSVMLKEKLTQRIHVVPLIKFIPFFIYASVRGGVDVARRVYSPDPPLAPALLTYPLCLPRGAARVFFANSVSLLPGTLSAKVMDHALRIHVLDETAPTIQDLNALELKIAGIFGIELCNTERTHEEHKNETL